MENINIFDDGISHIGNARIENTLDNVQADSICDEYNPSDAIREDAVIDSIFDEYTADVYRSPAIVIQDENNFKSIKAVEDIKSGELLLIEHAYSNIPGACKLIIQYNEYLFDQYHPRTTKFKDTVDMDKTVVAEMVGEKFAHNCFGLDEKKYTITSTITKINHSCDPNCAVQINEKYNTEDTETVFMEMFAVRNISKGTELTISYGPVTSHERDFVCDCGKTLEVRTKYFNVISNITTYFSHNNNDMIREKICSYLKTSKAKKILLNHYLSNCGIFVNNGIINAYTIKGMDLINDIINAFMNIDPTKFNDEIKAGPMTPAKISMFMAILENNFFGNQESE